MRWLESQEEAAAVPEPAPVDDGITRIDEMLDMMHNDRQELKKQVGRLSCSPVVPDFIQKMFQDEAFTNMCLEKFDLLDVDRNGVLAPHEVFPVILELSLEQPVSITYEHCARFVDMFDQDKNGVLSKSEFVDFVKFVWFMRWLESQEEQAVAPEPAPVDDGITRIDQMLDMMHNDRQEIKNQVGRLSCSPVVPDFIQKTFQDEGFIAMCLEKFDSLDIDRNGVLSPSEVYPVIL